MTEPKRMRLARLFLDDTVFFFMLVVLVAAAFLLGIYCGDRIATNHYQAFFQASNLRGGGMLR